MSHIVLCSAKTRTPIGQQGFPSFCCCCCEPPCTVPIEPKVEGIITTRDMINWSFDCCICRTMHPMNGLPMYPSTRRFRAPMWGHCEVPNCGRSSDDCVTMDVDNGNCTDKPFERWSMVLCPAHKAEAVRVARRDGNHVYDHDGRQLVQGRLLNHAECAQIRGHHHPPSRVGGARLCSICGGTGTVPGSGHPCPPCQATGLMF